MVKKMKSTLREHSFFFVCELQQKNYGFENNISFLDENNILPVV